MEPFDPNAYIHKSTTVVIRKNSTGETRTIDTKLPWYDHSLFFWTDGNFGCDCNRHLLWVEGTDESDERRCGNSAYTVIKAMFPDGTEIEVDGDPIVQKMDESGAE